jgi:hypothetical protein
MSVQMVSTAKTTDVSLPLTSVLMFNAPQVLIAMMAYALVDALLLLVLKVANVLKAFVSLEINAH